MLDDHWMKVFTVLYQLIGISILMEVLRRLGMSFVSVQADAKREQRSA